jgi:hypothetical protein
MTEVQWAVRDIADDEQIPEPEICPESNESDADAEEGSGDGAAQ